MLASAYGFSTAYDIVLVLHIACVIIGFGTVILNGVRATDIRARRGPEGLAIAESNLRLSLIAEYFIYAVFVLGIALVLMSKIQGDRIWDFDQTWVWLSIVLYVVGIGISHGVLLPAAKRMNVLMGELVAAGPPPAGAPAGGPPPQAVELEALGRRIGGADAALNVLLATVLVLMVFKPGSPLSP